MKKTMHFSLLTLLLSVSFLTACGETTKPAKQKQQQTTSTQSSNTTQQLATEAASSSYKEGKHYIKVGSPARNSQGKIEVAEIFWYGCPHCNATQPYVYRWEETAAADVELTRVAAPLSGIWSFHAQVFYTNKSLGILDKVHQGTFDAIHKQGKKLSTINQVADYYSSNFGIDKDEYKKAFEGFSVNVEMKKAESYIKEYNISSVPSFIVGGAYLVTATTAGSTPGVFNVIDYLTRNEF